MKLTDEHKTIKKKKSPRHPPFLRLYNPSKRDLNEAAHLPGQWGHETHDWLNSTAQWNSSNTTRWLPVWRQRSKFLISNYTWTCCQQNASWYPFVSPPPHLFKKKESSCRQLLIKYFGFQLQLLYAHICCAINTVLSVIDIFSML